MKESSLFTRLDHIAILVKDMNKSVAYLQSLGFGSFKSSQPSQKDNTTSNNVVDDFKYELSSAQMGQTKTQLVQHISGESIYKEFLDNKGGGIHHLCFLVDNLDKELAELTQKGFDIAYRGTLVSGGEEAFLDTFKACGFFIQLLQKPPQK